MRQHLVRRMLTREQVDALVKSDVPDALPLDMGDDPYKIVDADTLQAVAICLKAPPDLANRVASAFQSVPRSTVMRGAGVRTASNTFGWAAPNAVIQRVAPARTRWAREWPEAHQPITDFAEWAWGALESVADPDVWDRMVAYRDRVHPDYRLGDSAWTSGIANDTVPLHYHHDRNNAPHSWSAMLCCRAGTSGGNLHIADYDAVLPVRDRDVLLFPGVDSVHGVTPITKRLRGGFRYTFVWYPVRAFIDAPGLDEALAAAQVRRTEVEENLLERQAATGLLEGE